MPATAEHSRHRAPSKSKQPLPPRRYGRLTTSHILRRIRSGTLLVDVFEGLVYVRRSPSSDWRELTVYYTPRGRPVIRLYYRNRRRGIMRARLLAGIAAASFSALRTGRFVPSTTRNQS